MKLTFNKYWMLVSLGIILNIFIYIFFSNKLEEYVFASIIEENTMTEQI